MEVAVKARTFALPIRNAEGAAANPRATSAQKVLCCPPPTLRRRLPPENSPRKKVGRWGCESQQEVATFAPRFNRRRFPLLTAKNFFSLSPWKNTETLLTFAPRFRTKKRGSGHQDSEKASNFFLSVTWKKQKAAYLCTPLQPEALKKRKEKHIEGCFEKKFLRFLAEEKKLLTFATRFDRKGVILQKHLLLSSGTR